MEKQNYRATLAMLAERYPMVLPKKDALEILGISYPYLKKLIKKGAIKEVCGKIPLGSIASYICG